MADKNTISENLVTKYSISGKFSLLNYIDVEIPVFSHPWLSLFKRQRRIQLFESSEILIDRELSSAEVSYVDIDRLDSAAGRKVFNTYLKNLRHISEKYRFNWAPMFEYLAYWRIKAILYSEKIKSGKFTLEVSAEFETFNNLRETTRELTKIQPKLKVLYDYDDDVQYPYLFLTDYVALDAKYIYLKGENDYFDDVHEFVIEKSSFSSEFSRVSESLCHKFNDVCRAIGQEQGAMLTKYNDVPFYEYSEE